jgi:hypothetical protein
MKIHTISSITLLVGFVLLLLWTVQYETPLTNEKSLLRTQQAKVSGIKLPKKTPEDRARFTDERLQYEFDMLKDPATGQIPPLAKEMAMTQALRAPRMLNQTRGAGFGVTPRGPNNFGGRTRALAFDVRYATNNVILAGGVSSGVFKSTNGGGTWTKVSSNNDIHNVTSLVQDPRVGQEDTWYYATGEILGNSASLGSAYRGDGIWKSTDNGDSWTRLGNSNGGVLESFDDNTDYCFRIVVDPTNGDVYVAALGVILRSQDGGTNWAQVLGPGTVAGGLYTDIVVSSTGTLYAALAGGFNSTEDGIWTSTTGNPGSWTRIANSGTVTGWNAAGSYGRVVLGLAPSNENILYALYDNLFNSECSTTPGPEAELFRYDASLPAWTDLSANMPDEAGCLDGNDPFAVQGGYDLVVGVKPDDPNTVFLGGTNLYRSTNGFSSAAATTRIGGYAGPNTYTLYANHHPDLHVLAFAPNNNDVLYSGSDGGIHSADITAGVVSWTDLNTDYVTYQYYHVAIDQTLGSNLVIGGTQDNGTKYSNGGTNHLAWAGGDGVSVGINAAGTYFWGFQRGPIYRSGTVIRPSGTSSSIFVTYFLLDPDNTEYLYYADGSSLYRATNASTVTTAVNASNWVSMTGVNGATGSNIRSLATSRGGGYGSADANRKLYIGTQSGQLLRLNDPAFTGAATVPANITPPTASAGLISSIAVNPNDDNEILVTYSNYNISSVFHTTNANSATPTWTEVEGNLSLPSHRSAAIIPLGGTTYYIVGTSVGLYCTTALNAGSTLWSRIGDTDIGFALCSSLSLRPADYTLLVGTHGNGMFVVEPPTNPLIDFNLTSSTELETNTSSSSCQGYTDVNIQLDITEAPAGDAVVTISTSGTATPGVDFDIQTPTVTFPNGSTAPQNVVVRIYDDSEIEADELLILDISVSGTTDATESTADNSHGLTIVSNDVPPGETILLSEDFENPLTFGALDGPDWSTATFTGGTGVNPWIQGSNGGMNGTGSIYVSNDGINPVYAATNDFTLIKTALINGTGQYGMEISFNYICNGNATDVGVLYYSFDGFNYNFIETYSGVTTLTNQTTSLPSLLDNNFFYIGFGWFNNSGTANNPPFIVDDVIVRKPLAPVETALNATDSEYLGPFSTVYFYDGAELIASIQNLSGYDYGCTDLTIDRAGTGATAAWSTAAGDELADKTIMVTPTNNAPGPSDSYILTLYYNDAEFTGWVAGSDPSHTTGDFKIVKSPGAISALNPGNQNAEVNATTTYNAYGSSDHAFSATFTNGFSGFGGGDPPNPVLPVELLELQAEQQEQAVALNWTTAWETNNDYFEVERSADGLSFLAIGTVPAAGNRTVPTDYGFLDTDPVPYRNFYRLRQVDSDGKYSLSQMVEIQVLPSDEIRVGPNPFRGKLQLGLEAAGSSDGQLRLYNAGGQLVYQKKWEFKDRLETEIELGHLAEGVYLYEIKSGTKTQSGKLVKH